MRCQEVIQPVLFQTGALHSGQGVVGVELVEALSRLAGQDTGLGTLGQHLARLLNGAGNAMDAVNTAVDNTARNVACFFIILNLSFLMC